MRKFSAYPVLGLMALLTAQVAVSDSTQLIGVNPQLSDGARALQLGDYAEGIRLTLEGLKTRPGQRHRASALNNLCAGYVASGQFEEAIQHCSDAIEINDRNWRMYSNRALAFLGKGQVAAAVRDTRKGLELNPDGPTLIKVRAMIRERGNQVLLAGID